MDRKIFWFDTETTGVYPQQNAMIQLAGMIEINGIIKEEINLLFRPAEGRVIETRALEVNHRTASELLEFPHLAVGIGSLKKTFKKYIDQYDRDDKFIPAGFNTSFDCDFLRDTFYQSGDQYGIGSWMFNVNLDVRSWVSLLVAHTGLRLPNYKLVTICNHFGIQFDGGAHDAFADIKATRELYLLCLNDLMKCSSMLRKKTKCGLTPNSN